MLKSHKCINALLASISLCFIALPQAYAQKDMQEGEGEQGSETIQTSPIQENAANSENSVKFLVQATIKPLPPPERCTLKTPTSIDLGTITQGQKNLVGSTKILAKCPQNRAYQLSIDAGANFEQSRRLAERNGSSAHLNYVLQYIGKEIPVDKPFIKSPGSNRFDTFLITVRVPKVPSNQPQGAYIDELTVTQTY